MIIFSCLKLTFVIYFKFSKDFYILKNVTNFRDMKNVACSQARTNYIQMNEMNCDDRCTRSVDHWRDQRIYIYIYIFFFFKDDSWKFLQNSSHPILTIYWIIHISNNFEIYTQTMHKSINPVFHIWIFVPNRH